MATMSKLRLDGVSKLGPTASGATGSAKALVKGMALVDVVAAADAPVRLHELVAACGLPRPTVVRLVDVLCSAGVLAADAAGGYSLGAQVAVWGQRYLERLDVRRLAREAMQELVAHTRETSFVAVRDHLQVLYVAMLDGGQAVRLAASVGSRMPLHSTGIGKALLAFSSQAVVEELLAHPLPGRTANTITDPDRLRAELAVIRERGYSVDDVENEEGVRCVAAPVRGLDAAVIAALSVAAPAYRFQLDDLHRLAPRVMAAAASVSQRMGYQQP